MNQRNGKIEFFRFIFCIVVVLFHLNYVYFDNTLQFTDSINFFAHGCIGVEFFFLVTGWLFAKFCYTAQNKPVTLGKDTVHYVWHKWFSIFPSHLVAFIITFVATVFFAKLSLSGIIIRFINAIPNLFLVQRIGIYSSDIIGEEWYISVMLLVLAILYPLCRKYYEVFTRIIAPLAGILLAGYLYEKYGPLSNTSIWDGFFLKTQIRGFAEICLGAFAFEGSRYLARLHFSRFQKLFLSAIEYGCYVSVLLFTCSTASAKKYELYALYALLIAVCLSFSNVTYGTSLFQNKLCYLLGKLSLPIYLSQRFARIVIQNTCESWSIPAQFSAIVILNILLAPIVSIGGEKIKNAMHRSFATISDNIL